MDDLTETLEQYYRRTIPCVRCDYGRMEKVSETRLMAVDAPWRTYRCENCGCWYATQEIAERVFWDTLKATEMDELRTRREGQDNTEEDGMSMEMSRHEQRERICTFLLDAPLLSQSIHMLEIVEHMGIVTQHEGRCLAGWVIMRKRSPLNGGATLRALFDIIDGVMTSDPTWGEGEKTPSNLSGNLADMMGITPDWLNRKTAR